MFSVRIEQRACEHPHIVLPVSRSYLEALTSGRKLIVVLGVEAVVTTFLPEL